MQPGGGREVTKEKAEMFCAEFGMEHLETSAKSGANVLRAFERLITIVHEKNLAARGGGGAGAGGGAGGGGPGGGGSRGGGPGKGGDPDGGGGGTLKLDEGNVRGEGTSSAAEGSGSCGC